MDDAVRFLERKFCRENVPSSSEWMMIELLGSLKKLILAGKQQLATKRLKWREMTVEAHLLSILRGSVREYGGLNGPILDLYLFSYYLISTSSFSLDENMKLDK